MTVNKIRVRNLAEAGRSHAVVLEKILSNQPKMLSAILIGNNIVNISASSLMTVKYRKPCSGNTFYCVIFR